MLNKKRWYTSLIITVLTAFALLWALIPVYIIISNSFRHTLEIKEMPPRLFFSPTFSHYQKVLTLDHFGKYFINSIIITGCVVILTLLTGCLAAYGLKICKSDFGKKISNMLLLGKMVPSITIVIPLYIMFNRVHFTNTYIAPILAHTCFSLSFVIWLINGFMTDIPDELIEAATVEGCSRIKIFPSIIIPLIKPALASAAILVMQSSWNELLFSLTLTGVKTYPLTVGVAKYVGALSVDWGKCSAAATMTMLPVVIAGFFMQKYLVAGMTAGAVKG
jgi:ABC-type glycerol-3-phosphate transport system permease component